MYNLKYGRSKAIGFFLEQYLHSSGKTKVFQMARGHEAP